MKIRIISFTNKGSELARRVAEGLPDHDTELIARGGAAEANACKDSLADICGRSFSDSAALVFIGAAGIAVRSVAPFVKDKLADPPVIVMDEAGAHVIPILSGHMGGANELALEIAEAVSAVPVMTTATDVSGAFSVDLFAKENGLSIENRGGIAKVSSAALEGKPVTICIKDYPPEEHADVLVTDEPSALKDAASIVLCPKKYAIGIGCRRGKSFEELRDFVQRVLADSGVDIREAGCIATIDVKKDEEGLRQLSQAWKLPLITFEAGVLAKAQGEFSSSEAVLERVGVDNVCERAAVLAAGPGSKLVIKKTAENGMTVAAAEKR